MSIITKSIMEDDCIYVVPVNCPNCKTNKTWEKTDKPYKFVCSKCGCKCDMSATVPIKCDMEVI